MKAPFSKAILEQIAADWDAAANDERDPDKVALYRRAAKATRLEIETGETHCIAHLKLVPCEDCEGNRL